MFSPKILSRYILKQYIYSFIATLVSLQFVVYTFDIIDILRHEIKNTDFGFVDILIMGLLKQGNMLQIILPFIVLLSSIITFWRLTKSSELVIIRAAGQSIWQFVSPVIIFAGALGIFCFTLFNPLSAKMYASYERLNISRKEKSQISTTTQSLWIRESKNDQVFILHANSMFKEKSTLTLKNVSLIVTNDYGEFFSQIEAPQAILEDKKNELDLQDAKIFVPGKKLEHIDHYIFETSITTDKIQNNFASPETVSFWRLPKLIAFFEASGFSAHSHILQYHSLIATPFILIAMVLIAAVFSIDPNQRGGGGALKLGLAIALGFLLFFMTKITYAMGFSSTLPVSVATYSPPLIFSFVAISILLSKEDG